MLQEISFLLMQEPRGSSSIHSSSEVQMEGGKQISIVQRLLPHRLVVIAGPRGEPWRLKMLLLFQAI